MSSLRPSTFLEKLIENVPNCNDTSVKKERKDFQSLFPSTSSFSNDLFPPQTTSYQPTNVPVNPAAVNLTKVKVEDTIDKLTIQGAFGWKSVHGVALPMALRENDTIVPVRIVEHTIIKPFSKKVPEKIFPCISINGQTLTENEARLFDEINKEHCDYKFGYQPFKKDEIVLGYQDVKCLYKFLEASREIFGNQPLEWLGFVRFNSDLMVPFIAKMCPSKPDDPKSETCLKKFVLKSMVEQKVVIARVEKMSMDEWDVAYLKMLLLFAGVNNVDYITKEDTLCSVNDLKWDHNFSPVTVEVVENRKVSSRHNDRSHSSSSQATHTYTPQSMSSRHSSASSSASRPATITHLHPNQQINASWMRASSSPTTTLNNLYQVSQVEVHGKILTAINHKPIPPYVQAILVSEAVCKIWDSSKLIIVLYILEKILIVRLYDVTSFHEDAFKRAGIQPFPGDKLVHLDTFNKCFSKLSQLMAGY